MQPKIIQFKLLKPIVIIHKKVNEMTEIEKDKIQKSIDEWEFNYHKTDNHYN
jgi:hypothetical protein